MSNLLALKEQKYLLYKYKCTNTDAEGAIFAAATKVHTHTHTNTDAEGAIFAAAERSDVLDLLALQVQTHKY
jgi:hypothetical protein